MKFKTRILEFAKMCVIDQNVFAKIIFGSTDFFTNDRQLTVDHLIKLSESYPQLNLNWVLTGKDVMIHLPCNILIEALEEELREKGKEISKLKIQLENSARSKEVN